MLYVYKALNDMAPSYLTAMTHLQNIDPTEYRQRLRFSSDQTRPSWLFPDLSNEPMK